MTSDVTIGTRPFRLDLVVTAGEPVDVLIPVLDDTGAVQDVTGWTGAAQVRAAPGAPVLHTFTVVLEGVTARVSATGAETFGWAFTAAQWDLELTDPFGVTSFLVAGWVRRYPTITLPS